MKKTVTVALDIGNVCVTLQPERALRALGLSRGTLPEEFTDAFCELECGRMETAEWLSIFRRATGNRFTETELLNIWNSIIGDPMPGMEEQVRSYTAKGVKFVYLSDVSRVHLDNVCRILPFAHLIADGIYSFEAGVRKPHSAIYELFESRHGIPDFYFDDKLCNVEAARKRGWNAVRFQYADQLDAIGDLV